MDIPNKLNLLSFLCDKNPKGTEQEIYAQWVTQASFVPPAEQLPIYIQMIRNFRKSCVPLDIRRECTQLLIY